MKDLNALFYGMSIGFLGSIHCIGMCGPIVFVLKNSSTKYLLSYNFGRITTYIILGLALGSIGAAIKLFGYQQYLSIFCGVIILLYYFGEKSKIPFPKFMDQILLKTKTKLGVLLQSNHKKNYVFIGLLNGLLPCGLLYFALANALSKGSILYSLLYMLGFGLATVPALFLLPKLKQLQWLQNTKYFALFMKYFILITAIFLILRGMNLGIPVLSPKIESNQIDCCRK